MYRRYRRYEERSGRQRANGWVYRVIFPRACFIMNLRWTKRLLTRKIAHLYMVGFLRLRSDHQPGLAYAIPLNLGGCNMNQSSAHRHRQEVGFTSRMNTGFTHRALLAVVALITMLGGSLAHADAIKLGNLWIENVTVDTFDGTELHYLVNGTPNKQLLTRIDGFKLAAYPQLEAAEEALKAGNSKQVLADFKAARARAREPWLRIWLDARMVPLMDREGESLTAVTTFIALVEAKANQAFLDAPPVRSAKALSKEDKAKVHDKLKALRKNAKDKTPLADALDELVEATEPGAASTPTTPTIPGTTPSTVDGIETVVPLPHFMLSDKPDAITRLIARGRFDQALERVTEEMKNASGGGRLSLLLFQRGVSQYYLALEMEKDSSKKEQATALYKDAGLSLYRIPTFFRNSPYVGAALIETAAVHIKINRPDIAGPLLDQAGAYIDPEDDKLLFSRLEKLREQLP
jgi:hypothetical protein